MAAVDTSSTEQQLAWEERNRGRAAIAALVAGAFTLAAGIYSQTQISPDFPTVGELQALAPALQGEAGQAVNPGSAGIEFLNDRAADLIGTSVLMGLGTLLAGYVLLFLFRATKARRPETPEVARYTILFGAAAAAILGVALQVVTAINAHDFVTADDRSRAAVEAVHSGGLMVALQALQLAGQLAIAFAFVLVSLNAMRAGLLTRFMGVLGIIVGVLFIVPVGAPVPVVQCFWLIALAPLFLQRWPNGTPPAWTTGKAVAWPSQQELRESRLRAQGKLPPSAPSTPDDGADPAPAPKSSAARKRRKRR